MLASDHLLQCDLTSLVHPTDSWPHDGRAKAPCAKEEVLASLPAFLPA